MSHNSCLGSNRVQAPTPLNLWVLTDPMGCSLPWRWGMSEGGHWRRRRPEWNLGECQNGTPQRKQPGFPRLCQVPHRQAWAPCLELLSEDTIVHGHQTAPHCGPGAYLPVCQGTPPQCVSFNFPLSDAPPPRTQIANFPPSHGAGHHHHHETT